MFFFNIKLLSIPLGFANERFGLFPAKQMLESFREILGILTLCLAKGERK